MRIIVQIRFLFLIAKVFDYLQAAYGKSAVHHDDLAS